MRKERNRRRNVRIDIRSILEEISEAQEYLDNGDLSSAVRDLQEAFEIVPNLVSHLSPHTLSSFDSEPKALSPKTMERILNRLLKTYCSVYDGSPTGYHQNIPCSSTDGGRAA